MADMCVSHQIPDDVFQIFKPVHIDIAVANSSLFTLHFSLFTYKEPVPMRRHHQEVQDKQPSELRRM